MKVGDYVRTKKCKISKIIKISEERTDLDKNIYRDVITDLPGIYLYTDKQEDFKSSPNIIDLIEVRDYVNGYKVSFVDEEPVMGKFVQCDYEVSFGTTNHYRFYKADIKSIVTKEQFESMEYKIKED